MRLPVDTIIATEKLTGYLLVKQAIGDKSTFLALGGYTRDCADRLLQDLRQQALREDATFVEFNKYGTIYEIRAPLTGPSGHSLQVRTIWMREHLSGLTKFITLVPAKPVVSAKPAGPA